MSASETLFLFRRFTRSFLSPLLGKTRSERFPDLDHDPYEGTPHPGSTAHRASTGAGNLLFA